MSQKPIRVLQVGMSDNYGGTEATIYGIYNHLDHSKIQFDFLNVYGHPIARQSELEASGAHVYDLLLKRREGYQTYVRGIKDFYKKHAGEFDVVQCNIQCLDQIDMARYAKQFGVKKTIVYAHNAGHGIAPSKMAALAIRWNKLFSHHYVDQYAGCSRLAVEFAFSKKDAKQAAVINTGIETSNFVFSEEKRNLFRQRFSYSNHLTVYGSAGRFDPQKNQTFLLKIFSEIHQRNPNARFFLSGRGPMESILRDQVHQMGLDSVCLIVTEFLDYQAFYSGIDAFILPSRFEGLGVVLVEAQCAGLVCFASQNTIPEEAKILDSFQFIPLSFSASKWADCILSANLSRCHDSSFNQAKRDIQDATRSYTRMVEGLL